MHSHYCDAEGHDYECSDDCECFCGLPMERHDYSDCPIQLRPCAEHEPEHERRMAEVMSAIADAACIPRSDAPQAAVPHCLCGCADLALGKSVGFCIWCDHVYAEYSSAIENQHFARDCSGAPEEAKQAARERLAKRGS